MSEFEDLGADWLAERVGAMPVTVEHVGPVEYNEATRFLPDGLSPRPGFIRYDLFPYLVEILECMDPRSPVREVNLMKGVQTGYTTVLESVILYAVGHVRTQPLMFLTADSELAHLRVDNNIIPMLNESGMGDRIRSADVENTRKTGKTKNYLQWEGGGFGIFNGALNAAKMRMTSVPYILKDELDGWRRVVGKDGDSDKLTDARASAYWAVRKIFRGSTPLTEPSMIGDAFERGDKREYCVCCRSCGHPQPIRMEHKDSHGKKIGGFAWDIKDGALVLESVRYLCRNCGHAHFEHDKEKLFSAAEGAVWVPTAEPREPGVRSYHLPAWYSPYGFRPWYKGVSDYLAAFDPETKRVISIGALQEFYNNTLGMPFKVTGSKIKFQAVSGHRRPGYAYGQVPNTYALEFSGSRVLFLVCTVDVHDENIAVGVFGFCRDTRTYLVQYERYERGEGEVPCSDRSSPVWGRLGQMLETARFESDDGLQYPVALTFVDASYQTDTVVDFCGQYETGVFPIMGRERPAKFQTIKEFAPFTTQAGTRGFRLLVDHYKDRLAPVLRREWDEIAGVQAVFHFNAPVNATDAQMKELTREYKREEKDGRGETVWRWHRPGNADNTLWDLLVYAHAAVDVLAWSICVEQFELDSVDWAEFWRYVENEKLYFEDAP